MSSTPPLTTATTVAMPIVRRRTTLPVSKRTRRVSNTSAVRDRLARRFQQNWISRNPEYAIPNRASDGSLDDSLTSLNWLQNLNIVLPSDTPPPSPPSLAVRSLSMPSASQLYSPRSNSSINPNSILNCQPCSPTKNKPDPRLLFPDICFPQNDGIDYKHNANIKPPYSYSTLIYMAMRDSRNQKMTLADIYRWIMENFRYYRGAEPSWQNSIRHNLSLNKCFQKVARRKDEPGKGGFWRIHPDFIAQMERENSKKRKFCATITNPLLGQDSSSLFKRLRDDFDLDPNPVDLSMVKPEPLDGGELDASFTQQSGALKGDFTFNSLLMQDIEVEGVKIKTEEIIDEEKNSGEMERGLLNMTPSDSGSDLGIDDLFTPNYFEEEAAAVDQITQDPLDLSIAGIGIKAPDWWDPTDPRPIQHNPQSNSGMSTPVALTAEEDADHNSFLDNLAHGVDLDSFLDI